VSRSQRATSQGATTPPIPGAAKKKLSNKEQREHAALPAKIEALEAEDKALQERVNSPEFYKAGSENIRTSLARVESLAAELKTLYARWAELDEKA
jgi:ATP-binding cassette subfamily F protein uup